MPAETKTDPKAEPAPEPTKVPEPAPKAEVQSVEPEAKAAPAPGMVRCRITKFGHDKIYTGETRQNSSGGYDSVPGTDDEGRSVGVDLFPRFSVNTIIDLPIRIAQKQETAGFLEIQD